MNQKTELMLIEEHLRRSRPGDQLGAESVLHRIKESNPTFDWAKGVQAWSHLVRIGVIASIPNTSGGWRAWEPHTVVTEPGRRYLESGEVSPHDSRRYLDAIVSKVQGTDPVVLVYVEEAIGAWEARLYRSAMVMLGCAYEKIVLELVGAIAASTLVPSCQKLDKAMKAPKPPPVSALFDDVSKAVKEFDDQKLLGAFADAWDRYVVAAFEHVRVLRNSAGHPTGAEITAQEAEGALLMFPTFYARMHGLTTQIANAAP